MRQPVRLPATNGHGLRLATPRVLLLGGGNAAGKTTALKAAQQRYAHRTDWLWLYPDHDGGDLKGKTGDQLKMMMKLWSRRDVIGIAMEGTRIHDTVLRCMVLNQYPRHLHIGFINQTGEVLVQHLRERCARRGKKFREDYWGGPKNLRKATYEGSRRIPTVVEKMLGEHPEIMARVHARSFQVDAGYDAWVGIHAWIDQVVGL